MSSSEHDKDLKVAWKKYMEIETIRGGKIDRFDRKVAVELPECLRRDGRRRGDESGDGM